MKLHRRRIFDRGRWSRREEPPWQDPAILLKSCADLECSNLDQIQAALAVPTTAFSGWPPFRNFVAHRNGDTLRRAQDVATSWGVVADAHPLEILTFPAYGRPQSVLLDWLDDLRSISELLCS